LFGYIIGSLILSQIIGGVGVLVVQALSGDKHPEPLGFGIAVTLAVIPLLVISWIILLVMYGLSFRKEREPLGSKLKKAIEER
jgi:hypothetical protein